MAEEEQATTEEEAAASKGPGLIVWAILGVVAAGGGFAVPFFLPTEDSAAAADEAAQRPGLHARIPEEVGFVPFPDKTVNLNDGRLNRYLHVSFSLQVEKSDEAEVTELVEKKKAILSNWLVSHLSDKSMDDIRGAAGQNRLRREIQDQFNTVLFPDGYDRIYDVLFEDFNVQ